MRSLVKHHAVKGGGVALGALALLVMSGITAAAETDSPGVQDAVQAIDNAVGELRTDAVGVIDVDDVIVAGDTLVELSNDAADGVEIAVPGVVEFAVGLPFAENADAGEVIDGTLVFDNNNGSSTAPLVLEDGSVQILTTIMDRSAPTEYAYDYGVGATIEILADGSAAIFETSGGVVTPTVLVKAPWAFDASGALVATHFEVRGTDLVQVVEHSVADVEYPVVADPTHWWGWEFSLSNSVTNKVVKAVAGAAAATGVAAALQAAGIVTAGSGAATAVVAALIAFGATALDVCNWNDRGVTIRGTWTGQFWCWPR